MEPPPFEDCDSSLLSPVKAGLDPGPTCGADSTGVSDRTVAPPEERQPTSGGGGDMSVLTLEGFYLRLWRLQSHAAARSPGGINKTASSGKGGLGGRGATGSRASGRLTSGVAPVALETFPEAQEEGVCVSNQKGQMKSVRGPHVAPRSQDARTPELSFFF